MAVFENAIVKCALNKMAGSKGAVLEIKIGEGVFEMCFAVESAINIFARKRMCHVLMIPCVALINGNRKVAI